jgi:endogenous inhibitor of DNA gyrase (YacG/DUF329 family)
MPSPPLCVQCRQRPTDPRWRPFCSERCKMTDLGRWLSGDYRIPTRSGFADDDEPDGVLEPDGQHAVDED